jgi:hypothetical protein
VVGLVACCGVLAAAAALGVFDGGGTDDDDATIARSGTSSTSSATTSTAPASSTTTGPTVPALPEPLEYTTSDFPGDPGSCVASDFAPASCDQPHIEELFATPHIDGEDFPGITELQLDAAVTCENEFVALTGRSSADAGFVIVASQPTQTTWYGGFRKFGCYAASSEARTGSITAGTVDG